MDPSPKGVAEEGGRGQACTGGRKHRAGALVLLLAGALACARRPQEWREPVTGMELVLVPAGELWMGAPAGEPGFEADETLHRVRLTHDFFIGRYEVTQQEWTRVMRKNPSHFRACGPRCPVENVNWYEVHEFLRRLSAVAQVELRLPTEAEWEYAARARTRSAYSSGATLERGQANLDWGDPQPPGQSGFGARRTFPVGRFAPNPWGLFDLQGNVWEWCEDDYCPYPDGAATDPLGTCPSGKKVIRGGSWYFGPDSARSALRYTHAPADRGPSLGFRVVRPL